jgi:hypothetical protein
MSESDPRDPASVRIASAVYRLLLRAYPREFRDHYSHEMLTVFRDRCRDAVRAGNLFAVCGQAFRDWLVTCIRERLTARPRTRREMFESLAVLRIAAIGAGLFAAWVDFHNDEPQAPMLVIVIGSFLLGVIRPQKAWLWGLIIGLCMPAAHLIGPRLGMHPIDAGTAATSSGALSLAVLIIPAIICAYLGAGFRKLISAITR